MLEPYSELIVKALAEHGFVNGMYGTVPYELDSAVIGTYETEVSRRYCIKADDRWLGVVTSYFDGTVDVQLDVAGWMRGPEPGAVGTTGCVGMTGPIGPAGTTGECGPVGETMCAKVII